MSEPQRLSGSRWASGGTAMDPVRNPYAPGAGQRPPELTGRDREIGQFEVVLERVARGRPERSRSEEHTSELQSHSDLVCRLLLEKKKIHTTLVNATQQY